MKTVSKHLGKANQSDYLLTDDTLKERFGQSPLFTEKIEKATQIMSLVRQKQIKNQKPL
ncbi:hypothetical protein BH09BAC4_BH09BAC4_24760 [soil metagenome]